MYNVSKGVGSLQLSAMVLPILITNIIGAKFSTYFYLDMMIANLLYIIPMATSQSLFAEGSYSERELKVHFKKSDKNNFYNYYPCNYCNFFIWKLYFVSIWEKIFQWGIYPIKVFIDFRNIYFNKCYRKYNSIYKT